MKGCVSICMAIFVQESLLNNQSFCHLCTFRGKRDFLGCYSRNTAEILFVKIPYTFFEEGKMSVMHSMMTKGGNLKYILKFCGVK